MTTLTWTELRERYAGQAMAGMLASTEREFGGYASPAQLARHAIYIADALVESLKEIPRTTAQEAQS